MKQPKGVIITEIIVLISLLAIFFFSIDAKIKDWTLMFLITYIVGYFTIWNKITKFVQWNFNPENYEEKT